MLILSIISSAAAVLTAALEVVRCVRVGRDDRGVSIEVVSVVAGAAVAISVPLVSAWREDRRTSRQTNAARLDELRDVLDDAAVTLRRAVDTADEARAVVDQWRRGDEAAPGVPTPDNAVAASRASYAAIMVCQSRLAVRLGDAHELSLIYESARRNYIATTRLTYSMHRDGGAPVKLEWRAQDAAMDACWVDLERFYAASASVVGPDTTQRP